MLENGSGKLTLFAPILVIKAQLNALLQVKINAGSFKVQKNVRIGSEMTILNAIISLGVYLGILVLFVFLAIRSLTRCCYLR